MSLVTGMALRKRRTKLKINVSNTKSLLIYHSKQKLISYTVRLYWTMHM